MFHNQSEERDNQIELKYLETYEQWKKDNNITKKLPKNFYLDNNFFQFIAMQYRDHGTYSQEFGECIDILIRKNITSRKFIRYPEDIHNEMYSLALFKIYEYTVKGFDENCGKAFVFYTTAITNAFLEVIKNYYKTKDIATKLLKERRVDAVAYNYEGKDVTEIEDNIKTALSYMEHDEHNDVIEDTSEFIETIKEKYPTITSLRLIVEPNVPKFKRRYNIYNYVIPVLYKDNKGNITEETHHQVELSNGKIKSVKNTLYKGIIIEYFDLRVTNEASGTTPHEIFNKAKVARLNGHQTVFVYSDSWNLEQQDDNGDSIPIGRNVIMQKISDMIEYIKFDEKEAKGKNLQDDYIPTEIFLDSELEEPFYYGLHEDRKTRMLLYKQDIEEYIKWLDEEKNATRVYSCGRIKI